MKEFKQIELKEQELTTVIGGNSGIGLGDVIRFIRDIIDPNRPRYPIPRV